MKRERERERERYRYIKAYVERMEERGKYNLGKTHELEKKRNQQRIKTLVRIRD